MSTASYWNREQAMKALAKGDKIRRDRAALKRRLAAGEVHILGVISKPPPCAHSATILDALRWPYRMGKVRAKRVLHDAGVGEGRKLGNLTPHEVLRLELALRERCQYNWARWEATV